jgi:hypothetical protein
VSETVPVTGVIVETTVEVRLGLGVDVSVAEGVEDRVGVAVGTTGVSVAMAVGLNSSVGVLV